MARFSKSSVLTATILAAFLLAGCGGGGGGGDGTAASTTTAATTTSIAAPAVVPQSDEPQVTNDIATDGVNWFNYRRQQMGMAVVKRNGLIDVAALGHSNYQRVNGITTHVQTVGKQAFTGVHVDNRLTSASYEFKQESYAFGEVISSTGRITGPDAAEGLIAAIYHRFVIFDPSFTEVGAGVAAAPSGYTYFTTKFTVDGLKPALGSGKFVTYPFSEQQQVPVIFYSDFESPDPVKDRNEVGYPISVHADITASVTVKTFTVKPRDGALLATRLLTQALDPDTSASVASIIPLEVLAPATTYDVQFVGTVDGVVVNRSWSFKTR